MKKKLNIRKETIAVLEKSEMQVNGGMTTKSVMNPCTTTIVPITRNTCMYVCNSIDGCDTNYYYCVPNLTIGDINK
ncbi:MAG: class I lanthipeptide [Hyphomicrobiales bacterium]